MRPEPRHSLGRRAILWLLDKLFAALLSILIGTVITVRAVPQAWAAWVSLPLWLRLLVFFLAAVALALAWRFTHLRSLDRRNVAPVRPPRKWGYKYYSRYEHDGVVWTVEHAENPLEDPWDDEREKVARLKRNVWLAGRPLCAECGVTLEQRRRFWRRGFVWLCPGCDARVYSPVSWTVASQTALTDLREQLEQLLRDAEA